MPDSRDTSGRFPKGVSPNPGGKSLEREALRRASQDYLAEKNLEHVKAIEVIAAKAKSDKVKLDARIWLAEQFLGRPAQAITGADGGPVQTMDLSKLSLQELEALEAIRRVAAGETE